MESKLRPDKSDKELRKLALDIADDKVFIDWYLKHDDDSNLEKYGHYLTMVFMPLALGAFKDWNREDLKELGMIYEYLTEAGPRSINGYPSFMSLQYLKREEASRVHEYIIGITKQRNNFINEGSEWKNSQ